MIARILHAGVPHDLQARLLRIIHQEKSDPIRPGEIARREQLTITLIVGEGERGGTEHAQKSGWAAAMLNVGPAGFADRRQIETIARADEIDLVVRQQIALRRSLRVLRFSVIMFLRPSDGFSLREFLEFWGHG